MSVYNCRKIPDGWRMNKFDDDLNLETSYDLSVVRGQFRCQCFQANKPVCRHRTMLQIFIDSKQVDGSWFFNFDKYKWEQITVL